MIFLFSIGFLEVSWIDVLDILLVSLLLYQVYKLMRGSVAVKIFIGILFLYFSYLLVRAAQMELLSLILGQFMGVGVLAAIILFQPEIRKFLLLVGRTTGLNQESFLNNFFRWKRKEQEKAYNITPIVEAAKALSLTKTGALIVFSRNSQLKFYSESGDTIDAQVSKRLLLSIFDKHSPLHDGAVIINKGRIVAARCVLPVSEKEDIPAHYGMRHRAAMGMSDSTGTLVLIVSEENGAVSVAENGYILYDLNYLDIRKRINDYLFHEDGSLKQEKVVSELESETQNPEAKSAQVTT